MYEGASSAREYSSQDAPRASQEVFLKLPGRLGALRDADRERFDNLIHPRIIPWIQDGYRLGLNGLFTFTPPVLVKEVEQYLEAPPGVESEDSVREALEEKLRAVWTQHFDRINNNLESWT